MSHATLRCWLAAALGSLVLVVSLVEPPRAAAGDHPDAAVVKAVYAAFARGDIAAVLDRLADGIEWEIVGPAELCACYGRRTCRTEVEAFFRDHRRAP